MLEQNIVHIHDNAFSSYNLVCRSCMFEPDFEISNLQPNWKLNLNFAPVCLTNMYDTILDGYEHSPARENGGQQSLSPITIMMVALIRLSEKICRTPRSRTHNSCCNRRWGQFSKVCIFPWSYIKTMVHGKHRTHWSWRNSFYYVMWGFSIRCHLCRDHFW